MSHKDRTHKDPKPPADGLPKDDPNRVEENAEETSSAAKAIDETLAEEESAAQALLQVQLEEARDRELRARAELENFKKRTAREVADELRYANLPLMRDLLPVLDNMERALSAAEKNQDASGLLEGFKMVVQQFHDVLGRHHCKEIEALGQPFDPHRHQAVCQQPTDECPPNTVVDVMHAGFQLHDRVVRPSQVIVSTEKKKETE